MSVVIETTIGDLTVDLFTEERPVACLNFIKLCKLKYYNYNLFHTVEQGFIAQSGDPTGVGDGGTSVWGVLEGTHKRFFEAESLPKIYHNNAGLLSLVSAGKNLVGSQFFFTLGANLTSLDGIHCVIGEIVEGHETLRKLNEAIVDESFRPYQDIRITHTVLLEDPFQDPRGFQVPSRSPSPRAERLKNGRIAADEDIDDTDGKSLEEIQEMLAEREANARATILEIVGDLPSAEMAPPENVLFVCKLNPVTTDDDLEIIFSRFGKVKSCEVIRDRKSGDSLQYAFVEFEERKSCEAAYFKMDNVLIDDRRIHVDFSQSVAKVKWRGKGRGVEGPDGRIDFNNLRKSSKRVDRYSEKQRQFDKKEHRSYSASRLTADERRRAREERHREQDMNKSKNRSRSRSYSRERFEQRRRDERRADRYVRREADRKRRSRSRSSGRGKKYSPEEGCSRRLSDRRTDYKSNKRINDDNRTCKGFIDTSKHDRHQELKRKKEEKKMKYKKSRRRSSSSDTKSESDQSETSSSNSSSEASSSAGSSRRKKKTKKSKKTKKLKSKKKSKKHKK